MEKEKKEAGMQKKNFKDGIRLSPLGMGAMRLPQTEEGFAKPIDEPRAQEIIDYCIQHGVNYFDTAYIYHGGQSETFLGKALKNIPGRTILWRTNSTCRPILTTLPNLPNSCAGFRWNGLIFICCTASRTG